MVHSQPGRRNGGYLPERRGDRVRPAVQPGCRSARDILTALAARLMAADRPPRLRPRFWPSRCSSRSCILATRSATGIGMFKSRYSTRTLERLAMEKQEAWRVHPLPLVLQRVSREDQYMTEGVTHVQTRNELLAANDRQSHGMEIGSWRNTTRRCSTRHPTCRARGIDGRRSSGQSSHRAPRERSAYISTANPIRSMHGRACGSGRPPSRWPRRSGLCARSRLAGRSGPDCPAVPAARPCRLACPLAHRLVILRLP